MSLRKWLSKKVLLLVLIVLILAAALFQNQKQASIPSKNNLKKISIAKTNLYVETVRSTEDKAKGLSGRTSLGDNEGMLFVWEKNTIPAFWMRGMLIPIDIIWISDGVVIGIEENVRPEPGKPDSQLSRYVPPKPIDHVLEAKAGFTQTYGVKIGDQVDFSSIN